MRTSWLWALLLLAAPGFAAIDAYEFKDPAQEQRFRHLIAELRCPKCQNQSIADSHAPLSEDLRRRAYAMMQAGHSDAEIKEFMVTRYGDFIIYRPPLKPTTWLLWFGPFAFMTLALFGLMLWLRRRGDRSVSPELGADERRRLAQLLDLENK